MLPTSIVARVWSGGLTSSSTPGRRRRRIVGCKSEFRQYTGQRIEIGGRQTLGEQGRDHLQVRRSRLDHRAASLRGQRDLDAPLVVVSRDAVDQSRLLHAQQESTHPALTEQQSVSQRALTQSPVGNVGKMD